MGRILRVSISTLLTLCFLAPGQGYALRTLNAGAQENPVRQELQEHLAGLEDLSNSLRSIPQANPITSILGKVRAGTDVILLSHPEHLLQPERYADAYAKLTVSILEQMAQEGDVRLYLEWNQSTLDTSFIPIATAWLASEIANPREYRRYLNPDEIQRYQANYLDRDGIDTVIIIAAAIQAGIPIVGFEYRTGAQPVILGGGVVDQQLAQNILTPLQPGEKAFVIIGNNHMIDHPHFARVVHHLNAAGLATHRILVEDGWRARSQNDRFGNTLNRSGADILTIEQISGSPISGLASYLGSAIHYSDLSRNIWENIAIGRVGDQLIYARTPEAFEEHVDLWTGLEEGDQQGITRRQAMGRLRNALVGMRAALTPGIPATLANIAQPLPSADTLDVLGPTFISVLETGFTSIGEQIADSVTRKIEGAANPIAEVAKTLRQAGPQINRAQAEQKRRTGTSSPSTLARSLESVFDTATAAERIRLLETAVPTDILRETEVLESNNGPIQREIFIAYAVDPIENSQQELRWAEFLRDSIDLSRAPKDALNNITTLALNLAENKLAMRRTQRETVAAIPVLAQRQDALIQKAEDEIAQIRAAQAALPNIPQEQQVAWMQRQRNIEIQSVWQNLSRVRQVVTKAQKWLDTAPDATEATETKTEETSQAGDTAGYTRPLLPMVSVPTPDRRQATPGLMSQFGEPATGTVLANVMVPGSDLKSTRTTTNVSIGLEEEEEGETNVNPNTMPRRDAVRTILFGPQAASALPAGLADIAQPLTSTDPEQQPAFRLAQALALEIQQVGRSIHARTIDDMNSGTRHGIDLTARLKTSIHEVDPETLAVEIEDAFEAAAPDERMTLLELLSDTTLIPRAYRNQLESPEKHSDVLDSTLLTPLRHASHTVYLLEASTQLANQIRKNPQDIIRILESTIASIRNFQSQTYEDTDAVAAGLQDFIDLRASLDPTDVATQEMILRTLEGMRSSHYRNLLQLRKRTPIALSWLRTVSAARAQERRKAEDTSVVIAGSSAPALTPAPDLWRSSNRLNTTLPTRRSRALPTPISKRLKSAELSARGSVVVDLEHSFVGLEAFENLAAIQPELIQTVYFVAATAIQAEALKQEYQWAAARIFAQNELSDMAAAILVSNPTLDQVGILGKAALAVQLNALYSGTIEVHTLDSTQIRDILLLLGVPQSVLNQLTDVELRSVFISA